jgi:cytochrome c-type biogenesis protein CcmH
LFVVRRALLILVALTAVVPAAALAAAPRASLPDVEDEVMCPVCGTALNLAESPQADRERAFIQRLIDQGKTKAQIKAALEDQYGPRVLALPKAKGFNLAAYLVPIALGLAALLALAFTVPRWVRRRPATSTAPAEGADISAADRARLDEDLARYDA